MFKLVRVLVFVAAVMAFIAPAAMADTYYNSMGSSFHYDEWDNPTGATLIKQYKDGSVYGFTGVAGAGVFMSNMASTSTPQFVSIDFSDFAATGSEGSFGLEISWLASDGEWDNLGIYRAATTDFEGFAVGYWDESENNGMYGADLTAGGYGVGPGQAASSATAGSLAMGFTGSTLEFFYKGGSVTAWTLLFAADLSGVDLGDEIAAGFTGENAAVEFANYSASATPIPGAIWLLGSGIVGLVGIRRKMKA